MVVPEGWQLFGFDHSSLKLEEARKREISKSAFALCDLNTPFSTPADHFDIVTCFETIEHTGNYRAAFDNLVSATKQGGLLIVSVPREVGIPGIAKFCARPLVRRRPYQRFFKNVSRMHYVVNLLTGGNIEQFRKPAAKSWGAHLGFDYRNFEAYFVSQWIKFGRCTLNLRALPFPRFNIIYVFRKC
jgi:2-polyprenyl-3-methyl-5-hydroxy-6-metoxy-1,4-benzoquinol methylase